MSFAATSTDVVERHALHLNDPTARELVRRWYDATSALRGYLAPHNETPLDLVDVSTLADLYVHALGSEAP
jgi:hypothetical protein